MVITSESENSSHASLHHTVPNRDYSTLKNVVLQQIEPSESASNNETQDSNDTPFTTTEN